MIYQWIYQRKHISKGQSKLQTQISKSHNLLPSKVHLKQPKQINQRLHQ